MSANQPMITCPVCGTLNTADRVFCRKCASDLHATVVYPAGQTPPPPPTAVPIKPIIIGGGVALVLIALVIGAVVALGGGGPPAATPTASPGSTELVAPTAGPTLSPTSTPAPTATPATPSPTPAGPATPAPTPTDAPPIIRFFTGPTSVDCTDPSFPGTIHLSWRIGNADGASLSIDGPGVYKSYDGVLRDDNVPFACDGNQHTYILVTYGGIEPPAEKDLVIGPASTP